MTLSTHAGKAGTRLASTGTGAHALGASVGLSLLEDVAAFSIVSLAFAHPIVALAVVVAGLALLALVAPLGWRLLQTRVAALVYLLQHKVVDRELPGLDTTHLPESAVLAFADNGVRPGEAGLILPAYVSALPGIPRWAPGFVALVPGGAVFACRGWFRTRVARVSRTDGRPVLLPRVTGYHLQAKTPKGRATFTFLPLTAPMGTALERTVAREAKAWNSGLPSGPTPCVDYRPARPCRGLPERW